MFYVKDIINRKSYTYFVAGTYADWLPMFDDCPIIKLDEKIKLIWI